MISISLCMIVKNEEDTIERCLDSIKHIVDEIVIIDTGSTDNTKEIVKKYTDKVYDFQWMDDFSIARNYSFSFATMDYVMWLDADDELLEIDQQKLMLLKQTIDKKVDVVIMNYNMGSPDNENIRCTFMRERLVKRTNNFKWCDPIHEFLDFKGTFINSDIAITHKKIHPRTRRNLDIIEKYICSGNELSERNWFYYAKELFVEGYFDRACEYYEKFITTKGGLLSNYLDACTDLALCYKIKNEPDKQLQILLKSFEMDAPRPEIICQIGYLYKEAEAYEKAIKWFELAPNIPKPENTWAAVMHEYWGYIPYMELVSCYYRMGNLDKAIFYNEKAAEIRPEDSKILHNRVFLGTIKEELIKKRLEKKRETSN